MDAIEHAYALADRGQAAAAVAMLEAAGRAGDAQARIELAVWYLQGRIVPRDLALTRANMAHAADLGDRQARMIFLSLLANGTGGNADWPRALRLLEELADDDAAARQQHELIAAMDLDPAGNPTSLTDPEMVSRRPEAMLFRGLLSEAECSYLIHVAADRLKPAVVIDSVTGRTIAHPVRTSDTAGFPLIAETPFIHAINRRIAAASGTTVDCGEPLQILRYRPGQEYRPHHDALEGETNQRIMTMLVYLNDGFAGGETMFMETGLRIKGRLGDALLFRNSTDDGRPDPASLHAGLPVTTGEKIIASRWIRQRPFGPTRP